MTRLEWFELLATLGASLGVTSVLLECWNVRALRRLARLDAENTSTFTRAIDEMRGILEQSRANTAELSRSLDDALRLVEEDRRRARPERPS